MKKILALVLGLIMLAGLLAGCGAETPSESNAPASEPPANSEDPSGAPETVDPMALSVEEKLAYAASLSNEELYELAKMESGTMMVYSTTSLCETAMNNFLVKYPEVGGAYSSVGEADMFTKLSTEIGTAAEGADMALLQNS